jgi:hypothetical protein
MKYKVDVYEAVVLVLSALFCGGCEVWCLVLTRRLILATPKVTQALCP